MTIAYWCILAAMAIPYLSAIIAKAGGKGFDNNKPREWLEHTEGFRKRAHWAQQNAFEAFPIFAASTIVGHLRGCDQGTLDILAIAFIGCRLAYLACYVADQASLRSVVWFGGLLSCVLMFFL